MEKSVANGNEKSNGKNSVTNGNSQTSGAVQASPPVTMGQIVSLISDAEKVASKVGGIFVVPGKCGTAE